MSRMSTRRSWKRALTEEQLIGKKVELPICKRRRPLRTRLLREREASHSGPGLSSLIEEEAKVRKIMCEMLDLFRRALADKHRMGETSLEKELRPSNPSSEKHGCEFRDIEEFVRENSIMAELSGPMEEGILQMRERAEETEELHEPGTTALVDYHQHHQLMCFERIPTVSPVFFDASEGDDSQLDDSKEEEEDGGDDGDLSASFMNYHFYFGDDGESPERDNSDDACLDFLEKLLGMTTPSTATTTWYSDEEEDEEEAPLEVPPSPPPNEETLLSREEEWLASIFT